VGRTVGGEKAGVRARRQEARLREMLAVGPGARVGLRGACRAQVGRRGRVVVGAADGSDAPKGESGKRKPPAPITVTAKAMEHIGGLKAKRGDEALVLRMGVKSGGCSGLSYVLDFEDAAGVKSDDAVMELQDGLKLVCDPKSLLYLFGMQLDYSDELIGGGFQFFNPNSKESCGCGKSFGV